MAKLARLSIPDEDLDRMATDMGAILDFMGAISAWDGTAAPPAPPTTRRTDAAHQTDGPALVSAAQQVEEGEVIVPPIKGAS